MENDNLENIVNLAKEGNKEALEKLVKNIYKKIYGLSVKMLYNPTEAKDATQEIKVITHLSTFRGESSIYTWVYKIAANYLLRTKKYPGKPKTMSFEEYEQDLDLDASKNWLEDIHRPLNQLYLDEIRIACLQGLLLCLNRNYRIVFLLADVFDVTSEEGASILGITPAAFRKRLSRARESIQSFLFKHCCLVQKDNQCKCGYHVTSQLNTARFEAQNIMYGANYIQDKDDNMGINLANEMDELNHIGFLYKEKAKLETPEILFQNVREWINSNKFKLL